MPYQIEWFVDQRILHTEIAGDVDIEEVIAMEDEMVKYVSEGIAPVHVIVDITHVLSQPSVFNLAKQTHARHPNLGWTLVVGGNSFTQLVSSTLLGLVGIRFRMFSSFEVAQEFLRKQDVTVPM